MKNLKKTIVTCLTLAIFVLGFASAGVAADTISLKLGNKMPETNPESKGIARFAELVEQKSEGRLKIIPYYGESLGNANNQLENVMMGTQDIYVESYSFFQSWVPELSVHTIPYLFSGPEEYKEFLKGDLEAKWEKKLTDKTGIRILNTAKNWVRGPYRVLVSKKPIATPDDLAGVKIRMAGNKLLSHVWNGLGGSVVNLAWAETYLGLKQGIVEAATSPIGVLYSMKFTEVCPYVMRTDEYNQQLAFAMNNKKFESLPEDLQKILVEAVNEAGEYETQLIFQAAEEGMKKMKEEHNMVYTEPDITPWQEKAKTLYAELEEAKIIPKGLVEEVENWKKSQNK